VPNTCNDMVLQGHHSCHCWMGAFERLGVAFEMLLCRKN
jgi:hypothetical protein